MIKAVIFDLDNTLYSYDRCNQYAYLKLQEWGASQNIKESQFRTVLSQAREQVKKQLDYNYAARHNRVLYFQKFAEILGMNPFTTAPEMYHIYWNSFLEKAVLFDGAAEFLHKLKQSSVKTAICTDMTAHIQFRKILKLGIENDIDCMVSSEETGAEKPSAVMYTLTAQKLHVNPKNCIYIGDDYQRDMAGAKNANMIPIYFSEKKTENILCFDSYSKITDYFEKEGLF